jgi:hypothetical protein
MNEMNRQGKEENGKTEEKIVRILTEKELSELKAMLEKDHAVDCMFLLMLGRGQWKHAKEFMRKLKLTLPDGTFRARMMEIEYDGLAKHEKIDPKKKRWVITESGRHMTRLLLDFFGSIAIGGTV